MGLNKYVLGQLIERLENCNTSLEFDETCVRGVNNLKQLMSTKADISERDLRKFQIVRHGEFVFNHRTSRNGSKFSIAYNDETTPIICTEDYVVFRIKPECTTILIAEWLYMFFNRAEFDRYVITNSWGSSTEFYNWEDICSIVLELPDIATQQKYVAIYKAMQANQRSYERGLEDLRLVCESYIDKLRNELPHERIGDYIALSEECNDEGLYTLENVRGVSIEKRFIETKADMQGVNLKPYYVVYPDAFAYVTVTSRNGEKISLAHNASKDTYICSSSYVVFNCTNTEKLLPRYLRIFFERSEFNRYARYNSWGSARETFDFSEMQDVRIPIPDITVQTALAELFDTYLVRRAINEKLKKQLSAMCPILIRGSLSDGG